MCSECHTTPSESANLITIKTIADALLKFCFVFLSCEQKIRVFGGGSMVLNCVYCMSVEYITHLCDLPEELDKALTNIIILKHLEMHTNTLVQ